MIRFGFMVRCTKQASCSLDSRKWSPGNDVGDVMTRAAHVTECYGLTGVAYLVQCGDRARERLFISLEAAMAYARKHNDKHHHGESPVLHGWPGVDTE